MTTVRELIAQLEDMPEDAEVRLAHQPSWPFEYDLGDPVEVSVVNEGEHMVPCLVCGGEMENDEDEGWVHFDPVSENQPERCKDGSHGEPDPAAMTTVVYLPEARQRGYLPGIASRELGWR